MGLSTPWPMSTFKPHQEIIWKNSWHRTTPSLGPWYKFNSTDKPSLNIQVCSQVLPGSLHWHCPCKSEMDFRARSNHDRGGIESDTGAALENRIKSELLTYWQCLKTSGTLFLAGCQCLREITTIIQQLEVNHWDFRVHNNFPVSDTQHHCKLKSF